LLSLSCLSRKASRASQEVRAEEAPLSERSEFGRRARTSEKRRGPPRSGGSRPASSGCSFRSQDKRKSRCKRESLAFDSRFSWLDQWITGRIESFHVASRRELLCRGKVAKPLLAGRTPMLRIGPLRSSPARARRGNSLRSDTRASSARSGSGARRALRLGQRGKGKKPLQPQQRKQPQLQQRKRQRQHKHKHSNSNSTSEASAQRWITPSTAPSPPSPAPAPGSA